MNPAQLWIVGAALVLAAMGTLIYRLSRRSRLAAMGLWLIAAAVALLGLKPSLWTAVLSVRLRVLMLVTGVGILYLTLDRIRRTSLKERYAFLWVLTGFIFFVLAVNPDMVVNIVQLTGMQYTSAIMMIVFLFLFLLSFHFSLALSRLEDDRRRLSQAISLLQERVDELERKAGTPSPPVRPPERAP